MMIPIPTQESLGKMVAGMVHPFITTYNDDADKGLCTDITLMRVRHSVLVRMHCNRHIGDGDFEHVFSTEAQIDIDQLSAKYIWSTCDSLIRLFEEQFYGVDIQGKGWRASEDGFTADDPLTIPLPVRLNVWRETKADMEEFRLANPELQL